MIAAVAIADIVLDAVIVNSGTMLMELSLSNCWSLDQDGPESPFHITV